MQRKKNYILTNIVVAHKRDLFDNTSDECPFNICEIKKLDLSDCGLNHPWDSNQLSEARSFLATAPDCIATPFVSFSSYRLAEKTRGNINHHDICRLINRSANNNVFAPYLIKNNLSRMINPPTDAPLYTHLARIIYHDLLEIIDFRLDKFMNQSLLMPFCNTFVCSTKTYRDFHFFISKVAEISWSKYQFNFAWASDWSSGYLGRETGLLIERATALWFATNSDLRILGPKWGSGFPAAPFNRYPSYLGWRSLKMSDQLDLTN